MIFILAAVVLGALSIGHEYLHGTLSPWLALPVSRWQLVAAKLAALAPLLVSLAILATLGLIAANGIPKAFPPRAHTIGLPLVYGLIVAPWLTMVARGPLGGVVFTLAVPLIVGLARASGHSTCSSARLLDAMSVFAASGPCWAATVMRLEALETHRDVDCRSSSARDARSRLWRASPIWACSRKNFGFSR